jgi:hypothetical protein
LAEKKPGVCLLSKLRAIHIYKADWSLIQKFFVSYKIKQMVSIQGEVPIDQGGSGPGSTIEMGLGKVVTYEIICNMRLNAGVMYNNAKVCYDRIIENLSNIELHHQSLPKKIATLHALTFCQIEYQIKHKLGISQATHKHNSPAPVYGVGQGACDAPDQWGFVCDALIKVYKNQGSDATIISAISKLIANLKIHFLV